MTKKPAASGAKPKPKPDRARLAVSVDDKPLPDEEARAIWVAFSAHMDEHEGDAPGFAKARGWVSATPTYVRGQAVLVIKTRPGRRLRFRAPEPVEIPATAGASSSRPLLRG